MSAELFTRGGFANPGTSLRFKTGTWRVQKPVYQYRYAPCRTVCPAGEDPQAYIAALDQGHLQQAWETLVTANPLPAITGRICHHPCESGCNRGNYDEPVAIHSIERFLGDQAIAQNWAYPVTLAPNSAKPVAVVGAGPAGLSCAYHLTRLGHKVTLFTALGEAGGTLHTIPGYRLPASVIEAEVGRVLDIGIDFRPNHRLGRDMYLDELRKDFKAVFLGVGTQLAKDWSVAGVTPRDLHVGLNVLKEWMAVGSVPEAKSVAIIGGGNTAIDLSRILKRAGIPDVHIITTNGLPGENGSAKDTMPAVLREIQQAIEEGIIIHPHRGIRRLILRGERVAGLEMVHMKKMQDQDGNMKRIAFEGTETVLHVDQVIPAIGQTINPAGLESLLDGQHHLEVDQNGQIPGHPGLFSGGDACSNSSGTVTAAVGDGRRAAEAMSSFIRDEPIRDDTQVSSIGYEKLNMNYYDPAARNKQPVLAVEKRLGEEEIVAGLNPDQIAAEARRCFSCGSCMACDNCWTLCPDSSVLKTREQAVDGTHYQFDYDYCKGCGLCAHECPCGFIEMQQDL